MIPNAIKVLLMKESYKLMKNCQMKWIKKANVDIAHFISMFCISVLLFAIPLTNLSQGKTF